MSKIVINRSSEYPNKFRKINIYLENQKIGEIKDGETKQFDIKPGQHTIYAKIDWCKSNDLVVTIENGETKTFDLSGKNPFLNLYYITLEPDKYLELKPCTD